MAMREMSSRVEVQRVLLLSVFFWLLAGAALHDPFWLVAVRAAAGTAWALLLAWSFTLRAAWARGLRIALGAAATAACAAAGGAAPAVVVGAATAAAAVLAVTERRVARSATLRALAPGLRDSKSGEHRGDGGAGGPQRMPTRSTTKTSVSSGPITPPAPRLP
jgi:hypothetical protein